MILPLRVDNYLSYVLNPVSCLTGAQDSTTTTAPFPIDEAPCYTTDSVPVWPDLTAKQNGPQPVHKTPTDETAKSPQLSIIITIPVCQASDSRPDWPGRFTRHTQVAMLPPCHRAAHFCMSHFGGCVQVPSQTHRLERRSRKSTVQNAARTPERQNAKTHQHTDASRAV